MSLAEPQDFGAGGAACPGCAALPDIRAKAQAVAVEETVIAVPGVHCAACITTLEDALSRTPGVAAARVNLTTRRARIRHDARQSVESLIAVIRAQGYEALPLDMVALSATETERQSRDLLMRLGVAFFAMMNVMLLSVAVWSGASDATRDMFHMIAGAIALPTVAFSGKPFFESAWRGVKAGRVGMDFPISLALVLASGISVYETFHSGRHAYFDGAVMLTFFLLGGRYLDHRTRAVARSAAQELAALETPRAIRLRDGVEEIVSVSDLAPGDLVVIRPGGRMPVDGVVVAGQSELDLSLLTGETLPQAVGPDARVAAGVVNLTGALQVRVRAAGRDSSLSRMAEMVAVAEEARNRYTSLADKAGRAYAPAVHALSFAAFIFWMWQTGGDLRFAVNISAAVLIITCPCALGLAVPAVVTAASGKLFRAGLLIKSGTALERLAEVDTVVFDKTGTLTLGTPEAHDLSAHDPQDLALAEALAGASAHPLAQALAQGIKALRAEGRVAIPAVAVTEITEIPGYGVEGRYQGRTLRLGRAEWVGGTAGAHTATWLALGEGRPVAFTFTDRIRPGAKALVDRLVAQGIGVHMLSGDVPAAVGDLAARLGIGTWRAQVMPQEKRGYVADLAAAGHRVLMVGDGLNDTAALAQAHVSISPATALDAARVASDIVLTGQDIAPVADALHIARQAVRRIRENIAISFGYNVVAVPVALIGLATPLLAAVAMSVSSITVTLNALRLKQGAR